MMLRSRSLQLCRLLHGRDGVLTPWTLLSQEIVPKTASSLNLRSLHTLVRFSVNMVNRIDSQGPSVLSCSSYTIRTYVTGPAKEKLASLPEDQTNGRERLEGMSQVLKNARERLKSMSEVDQKSMSKADQMLRKRLENMLEEEKKATEELENMSEEDQKKLKVIKLEHAVWFSMARKVPEHVSDVLWLKFMNCPGSNARLNLFGYYYTVQKKKLDEARKKKKRQEYYKELGPKPPGPTNSFLQRIRGSKALNPYIFPRLARAMCEGPHLVFDCSFGDHMTAHELTRTVKQYRGAYGVNKLSLEPYHFHFCNVDVGGRYWQTVEKFAHNVNLDLKVELMTYSKENYLDFYSHEKLVYLSPDAPHLLEEYDHDAVYIIGVLVDTGTSKPLTLAKAKREGIKMAKLPLDLYLNWGTGGKRLTLDQVTSILLDMKTHGDWEKAIRHVPTRKLKQT